MATSTPNHGLYKYGGDDSPDLTKLGPTMDKIDLELKKNADNIGLLPTMTNIKSMSFFDGSPSGVLYIRTKNNVVYRLQMPIEEV